MHHTATLGELIAGIYDEVTSSAGESAAVTPIAAVATYDMLLRYHHLRAVARLCEGAEPPAVGQPAKADLIPG